MNKLISVTIATLLTFGTTLGAAEAQNRPSDGGRTHLSESRQQAGEQRTATPRWKKGSRYAGKGSGVTDYGRHHLKAPPKGHRWIRDGNDFVLIAIGTGIVVSVVQGR